MSVKTAQELKRLQTQVSSLQDEYEYAQQEAQAAVAKASALLRRVNEAKDKLSTFQEQTRDPIISEHAILRYLERVKGMDMNAIRAEIMDEKTRAWVTEYRSGRFPVDGYRVIAVKGTIVSIET